MVALPKDSKGGWHQYRAVLWMQTVLKRFQIEFSLDIMTCIYTFWLFFHIGLSFFKLWHLCCCFVSSSSFFPLHHLYYHKICIFQNFTPITLYLLSPWSLRCLFVFSVCLYTQLYGFFFSLYPHVFRIGPTEVFLWNLTGSSILAGDLTCRGRPIAVSHPIGRSCCASELQLAASRASLATRMLACSGKYLCGREISVSSSVWWNWTKWTRTSGGITARETRTWWSPTYRWVDAASAELNFG